MGRVIRELSRLKAGRRTEENYSTVGKTGEVSIVFQRALSARVLRCGCLTCCKRRWNEQGRDAEGFGGAGQRVTHDEESGAMAMAVGILDGEISGQMRTVGMVGGGKRAWKAGEPGRSRRDGKPRKERRAQQGIGERDTVVVERTRNRRERRERSTSAEQRKVEGSLKEEMVPANYARGYHLWNNG